MSTRPWDPDRPLSTETALSVARAALSSAPPESIAHVGSGWDFDAFLTPQGWLIRFPRRADGTRLLQREAPILALARSVLPSRVAVPDVRVVEHDDPDFPYPVALHRYLPGVPADELAVEQRTGLARDLAETLAALHTVPEVDARQAGLEEPDRDEAARVEWLELGSAGLDGLRGHDMVLDRGLDWLERPENPLRRLDAPVRMIHHDLSPEHVLVEPASGRLIGILDWTDAVLGDPARDFVPLVTYGGWGFMDRVLEHYPVDVDAGFRSRLRFMVRLLPLMWLGHARLRGEETTRHVQWVRNAFDEGDARPAVW